MIDQALIAEFGNEISQYVDERFQADSFTPLGDFIGDFKFVCYLSNYVFNCLKVDPDLVEELLYSGDLARAYDGHVYTNRFQQVDLESLDLTLRKVRRREMIRIIFRDLTRAASLDETTNDLSGLADACLVAAHDIHYQNNCLTYGEPKGTDSGVVQQMTILALGKLGARELNVSSDIDLIFFYDVDLTI